MGAIFVAHGLRADNSVNDQLGFLRDAWSHVDNKILTKRQNKNLHQLLVLYKSHPKNLFQGPKIVLKLLNRHSFRVEQN